MDKTITVRGVGSVSVKPDYVVISMRLDCSDKFYEKAARLASDNLAELNIAMQSVGFEKDSIKTTDFNVYTEYRSVKDKNGNYRSVFDSYHYALQLKLSFDFDTKRLSDTISAIASCATKPEINISFTVKDPSQVHNELLKNAAENARAKAEILCQAAGAKLGELVSIDYNWSEINLISPVRYAMEDRCMPKMSNSAFTEEICPEDIKTSDSAAFVWKIC
ncbi:MAG: SIMPL domain-containing protein [Clostridia bacterium]|nr:SIMPL domain-containing protein [Clostridia bacterium]